MLTSVRHLCFSLLSGFCPLTAPTGPNAFLDSSSPSLSTQKRIRYYHIHFSPGTPIFKLINVTVKGKALSPVQVSSNVLKWCEVAPSKSIKSMGLYWFRYILENGVFTARNDQLVSLRRTDDCWYRCFWNYSRGAVVYYRCFRLILEKQLSTTDVFDLF